MQLQYTPYFFPLLFASLLSAALAFAILPRRRAPGAQMFARLMVIVSLWSMTHLLEVSSVNYESMYFWSIANFFSVMLVPVLWLIFTMQYIGVSWGFRRRFQALLFIPPAIHFTLAVTNPLHHFFLESLQVRTVGAVSFVTYEYGTGFFIHALYSYSLIITGAFLLLGKMFTSTQLFRRQTIIILLSIAVPWAVNIYYTFFSAVHYPLNPTLISVFLTSLILFFALYNQRLFSLVPVARAGVIDSMQQGVLVLDHQNYIVDVNQSAAAVMEYTPGEIIGRHAGEVLSKWPILVERFRKIEEGQEEVTVNHQDENRYLEISISTLYDGSKNKAGRLFVFQDVTQRKLAETALEHYAHSMEALYQTLLDINSQMNLTELLQVIVRRAIELVGVRIGGLYLLRPDGETLELVVSLGLAQDYTGSTIKLGEGLSGRIAQTGEPMVIHDYRNWEGRTHTFDGEVFNSVLGVPLKIGSRVIGVTTVIDDQETRHFSKEDVRLVSVFADQTAIAIENARLFQTTQNQARNTAMLYEITHYSLQYMEESNMLHELANRLADLIQADSCFLIIWDEAHDVLKPAAAAGEHHEPFFEMPPVMSEGTMTRLVLEAGHTIVVEDISKSEDIPAHIAARYPAKALLALPLISDGEKLGAALLGFNQPHRFQEDEIRASEQAAAQVALALAKVRAIEVAQTRAYEAETLEQVAKALASTLDQEQVLDIILTQMERVVPYDSACIFLVEGEHLKAVAERGFPDGGSVLGMTFAGNDELLNETRLTGKFLILPDAQADPRFKKWGASGFVRGWMGVPLAGQYGLTGFMTLDSRSVNAFSAEQGVIAQAFGNQAANAIEKARLYAAEQQRVRELNALHRATGMLLSTLDLDDLLTQILSAAVSAIPESEKGALLMYDSDAGLLHVRSAYGYLDERVKKVLFPVDGKSYAAEAVRQKKPLIVYDARGDESILYEGDIDEVRQVQSAIVAPLIQGERVIGVLSLDSHRRGAFTDSDLQLLVSFAAMSAMAISNAQLHREVQRLAITDALTSVYNLRGLFELGRREVERSRRFERPLAAILLDIDHFKQVNDTYGHETGNQVLAELARRCREHVRDIDIVARYGGEEFVVLLPESDSASALQIAERLRTKMADRVVDTSTGPLRVTISLGVSHLTDEMPDLAALINSADSAMYAAKQAGRNRVMVYNGTKMPR